MATQSTVTEGLCEPKVSSRMPGSGCISASLQLKVCKGGRFWEIRAFFQRFFLLNEFWPICWPNFVFFGLCFATFAIVLCLRVICFPPSANSVLLNRETRLIHSRFALALFAFLKCVSVHCFPFSALAYRAFLAYNCIIPPPPPVHPRPFTPSPAPQRESDILHQRKRRKRKRNRKKKVERKRKRKRKNKEKEKE